MATDQITISKLNEVTAILKCSDSQAMEMYNYFAEYAPNYIWHPRYKAGFWDGKLRFFNKQTKQLPFGLLPNLARFCAKFQYSIEFEFDPATLSGKFPEDDLYKVYDDIFSLESGIYPRDYQHNSILKSLNSCRGINRLSTGAGKSVIIYTLSRIYTAQKKKTILIVPNVSLVEQMYSDFKLYSGKDPSDYATKLYAGQNPDFNKPVLITTWQSIQTKHQDFFKKYDSLLIDECHQSKSTVLQDICKKCVNAKNRLGFTGTMPDNPADKMTIVGALGPVIYDLAAKTLMEREVLAQIKIKNIVLDYPQEYRVPGRSFDSEQDLVYSLKRRNQVLLEVFKQIPKTENVLILVHKIDHLKEIETFLNINGRKKVEIIYGEVNALDRERIRNDMDSVEGMDLVASYGTLSTGISVKRIHHIIFFSSYKSKIKILQSIGRGLRTHSSKEHMTLWDIVDDLRYTYQGKKVDNYIYRHWKSRKSYYDEQGFGHETVSIPLPENPKYIRGE